MPTYCPGGYDAQRRLLLTVSRGRFFHACRRLLDGVRVRPHRWLPLAAIAGRSSCRADGPSDEVERQSRTLRFVGGNRTSALICVRPLHPTGHAVSLVRDTAWPSEHQRGEHPIQVRNNELIPSEGYSRNMLPRLSVYTREAYRRKQCVAKQ